MFICNVHEVNSQLVTPSAYKHPLILSTHTGTLEVLCHCLQTHVHKHFLYQPGGISQVASASMNDMYTTIVICTMMQSTFTAVTPWPTVTHPLTPSKLPGTLEAFHHLQQTLVHIHSFGTALPYTKDILLL